ncbi:hypothetical protein [Zoogloea sp.]|uniref:restriction endonuclease subunit S n=1 Tax=Zoogloea sp. TaxID=49181 RepID=UPI001AD52568|nr:hypothetical protein [Zoogloea sp.]MBN8283781.1 hypothetical protein [Zoogloea sp.]
MSAVTEEFGGIDVSARRPLGDVQKGYTSFLANDVLLAKITPCMENGKLAVVPPLPDQLAFGSTEFHVLRAMSQVRPSWLAHFLSQSAFRKHARQNMTGSAGQLRVSTKWLADAQIPVAPAAEQTRIVGKLEELLSDLDAGVAELKAAQKKLTQYRQSLLKAAVEGALTADWRRHNRPTETGAQLLERILTERRARWEAGQLAKFKEQGKTPPKDWQKKYPEPVQPDTADLPKLPEGWVWASVDQLSPGDLANGRSVPTADNGAKVLRLTAVRDGQIDLKEFKCGAWTDKDARPFALSKGDLLVVRGNGSLSLLGRMGLVPAVTEPIAYPDTLIRLRVLESIVTPGWISTLWDSALVRLHLERRARTSAGIYKISQPDIVSVAIPVPPISEQMTALRVLDLVRQEALSSAIAIDHALHQSTAQRQNILRAAFSGQLVPQDPDDEPAAVLLERIRAERATQRGTLTRRGRKKKAA